jgi:hypothetical protein
MRIVVAGLGIALTVGLAGASDRTDVIAAVNRFNDSMNKGDAKAALTTCATPAAIIDEFPPYGWQGATACADWATDFDTYNKKSGITDAVATLGEPRHVDITGDRAYVVMPASYAYKQKGKKVTGSGSTLTAALRKVHRWGWVITGWAWSKR